MTTLGLKILDTLAPFRERIMKEREQRQRLGRLNMPFGVAFLDDCLGGIYTNDLIIIGAKTGIGKTQLATIIAMHNAQLGKRVHFFALEAEDKEIERRIKYQMLAQAFFRDLYREFPYLKFNFQDWYYGKFDEELGKVEDEIDQMLKDLFPSLWTIYRERDFTVEDFEKRFLAIQEQTDLVVVDHLHYFDSDDDNENRALKKTVKHIRDLVLLAGKPVLLLAHMRKEDRKQAKQIVPSLDDFHGSSDITKIATKVITLAPCFDSDGKNNQWPTYMRTAKNRPDSSRTRFAALVGFNANLNRYEDRYFLGRLTRAEDEFLQINTPKDLPYWAKRAKTPEIQVSGAHDDD